jgi:hypothetical protein
MRIQDRFSDSLGGAPQARMAALRRTRLQMMETSRNFCTICVWIRENMCHFFTIEISHIAPDTGAL